MIVISNTKVSAKNFTVPEILVVGDGVGNITIGAINKELNADFLAANPKILLSNTLPVDGYAINAGTRIVDYTGDEVNTTVQGSLQWYAISIFDNI